MPPKSPDRDRRPRILIVDDEAINVHALAAALGDEMQLRFATDGEQALRLADSGDLDLMLLDVRMPGLDGFEVCWRLKANERTQETLVIFVTASSDLDDEMRGFDAGGVDYITKPISAPIVRARVRTHLELKRSRDLLAELSAVDGLTGLANRSRLEERLELELRRAQRESDWLSLALIGVDHLEPLRRSGGEQHGDEVLRKVSLALTTVVRRPTDLPARAGDEEFALILPTTGPEGLVERVAALVDDFGEVSRVHEPSLRPTISIGGVSFKPGTSTEPLESLALAGQRLTEARELGGQRAVLEDLESGRRQVLSSVHGPQPE